MPLKERIHRAHHRRVARKRADHIRDTRRLPRIGARHVTLATAEHAHGKAATERLAVDHHVGLDGVCLLRALGRDAEAGVHLRGVIEI